MHKKTNGKPERVRIPSVALHPDTRQILDQIRSELACSIGIAIDELSRRFKSAMARVEELERK